MYWQSGCLKKPSTLSVKPLRALNSASIRSNILSLVLNNFWRTIRFMHDYNSSYGFRFGEQSGRV